MIRFSCPNCGREYILPDALAHLALLCKGCGQRLAVPDPSAEPVTEPEPIEESLPGVQSPAGTVDQSLGADTTREPGSAEEVPDAHDDVDLSPHSEPGPPPSGASEQPAPMKRAPAATAVARAPVGRGRVLERVVDVVVGLLLAGVGMLLGEFATRKGTLDVLREAGSAPKFPPVDLLLWLGCVAMPVLAYVLFANRGKSVGKWLRGRLEA